MFVLLYGRWKKVADVTILHSRLKLTKSYRTRTNFLFTTLTKHKTKRGILKYFKNSAKKVDISSFIFFLFQYAVSNIACIYLLASFSSYYTFNSLSLFWLTGSIQWIFSISRRLRLITPAYTLIILDVKKLHPMIV